MADVDPKQAKAKLEQYLDLQARFDRAYQRAAANAPQGPYGPDRRTSAMRQAYEDARQEQVQARNELLHNADDIEQVLQRVQLTTFSVRQPEHGANRDIVTRGIGKYTRWIETGQDPHPPSNHIVVTLPARTSKPKPKPAPQPAPQTPQKKEKASRALSFWATVAVGALSGAGTGLGASLLTSFYGTKQTCIEGDEVLCAPRNGVVHARVCTADGRRYGPCQPVDSISLTNPSASEPSPPIVAPPADGGPSTRSRW